MWKEIATWAFGFFSVPLIVAGIALGCFLCGMWFKIPEHFHLDASRAWMGFGLFAAAAILSGIVVARLYT